MKLSRACFQFISVARSGWGGSPIGVSEGIILEKADAPSEIPEDVPPKPLQTRTVGNKLKTRPKTWTAGLMIFGALSASASAFASKLDCSTMNDTVSAAGYYVSGDPVSVDGDEFRVNLTHVKNQDGTGTNIDENFEAKATFSEGRLVLLEAPGFEMKYSSDFDSPTDVQRGFYTVTATLENGRKLTIGANKYLMCSFGL